MSDANDHVRPSPAYAQHLSPMSGHCRKSNFDQPQRKMQGQQGLDVLSGASEYLRNNPISSAGMSIPEQDPNRPRKRRRAALACEQCRQRKLKCDRADPCGACVKSRLPDCVYQSTYTYDYGGAARGVFAVDNITPPLNNGSDSSHGFQGASLRLPPTPAFTRSPADRSAYAHQQPLGLTKTKPSAFDESIDGMNPPVLRGIRGTFVKGQLFGESHWTSFLTKASIAIEGIRDIAKEGFSDAFGLLGKCKALAREVKSQEIPDGDKLRERDLLLPSRRVADMLVDAYLQSLETIFQILDIQEFQRLYEQYWRDPASAPSGFQTSMTLIFAIGVSVCTSDHGVSRKTVKHWVYLASEWLNHPRAKMRLDLWSLRSHCLWLLARQANGVDGKTTALSAGSLVVTAMHMGLHVDPTHLAESQVTREEREVRRRLWAAVLELELQATMDSGGRPLVREDDYDCAPPSNINDLTKLAAPANSILPMERYTQSSIQILLARGLPIRLKIVRFVNDFRQGVRYQEALALSKELVEEMRRGNTLIEGWRKSAAPITQFQIEVFNVLMHRFLLALHYSYALKAKDEPLFYYSRKVCLDSSLTMLSPPVSQRDPAFYQLALHGRSAFQDSYIAAANFISEYISAEQASNTHLLPSPSAPDSALIAAIEGHMPLSLARIEIGETNVKSHLLYCCLLAHAKAVQAGTDAKEALRSAINSSLGDSYTALRARLEGPSPVMEMGANGMWGEDVSLENLFNWLQGEDDLGTGEGGAWMNGLDWPAGNGAAAPTPAAAGGAPGL